jgi:hypothetical protein
MRKGCITYKNLKGVVARGRVFSDDMTGSGECKDAMQMNNMKTTRRSTLERTLRLDNQLLLTGGARRVCCSVTHNFHL